METIYLGTSGFSYREWIGIFYPRGMKGLELLEFYAAHFNAVEVNNTFYRLPPIDMVESWKERVGPDFRFAVKAGQRITHRRDLGAADGYLDLFLARIAVFGERLGPVLFQFPPGCGNPDRILELIRQIQNRRPAYPFLTPAIELRNKNLFNHDLYETLRKEDIPLCFNDAFLKPEEWPEPLDTVYLRLRNGPYEEGYLRKIASMLEKWSAQGRKCFLFFKHETAAPGLARNFQGLLFQI